MWHWQLYNDIRRRDLGPPKKTQIEKKKITSNYYFIAAAIADLFFFHISTYSFILLRWDVSFCVIKKILSWRCDGMVSWDEAKRAWLTPATLPLGGHNLCSVQVIVAYKLLPHASLAPTSTLQPSPASQPASWSREGGVVSYNPCWSQGWWWYSARSSQTHHTMLFCSHCVSLLIVSKTFYQRCVQPNLSGPSG